MRPVAPAPASRGQGAVGWEALPAPAREAPPSPPPLSVVVVNYRNYDDLDACLASLATHEPSAETVVVDWNADEGRLAALRAAHPAVRIVAERHNGGFAAGVNLGVRQARAPHVLLLNPDALLDGPLAATLLAHLAAHPDVAVVGPRVRDLDGALQASARRFPGASTLLGGRSTWLTRSRPDNRFSRRNLLADQLEAPAGVDWVSGACMLVRRDAFLAVGGFDERYFLYWEDADFCRRLRAAGWQVAYHPGATVRHRGGRSRRFAPVLAERAFHRSAFRYYWRHSGPAWRLAAPVVWALFQARLLLRLAAVGREG